MSKRSVFAAALLGTVLLSVPLHSQAFFGFFGGGFSFGTGWGGWGGPGWWGPGSGWWSPGWYRSRYLGWPGYRWHRPYWRQSYWRRGYRPYSWSYLGYGWQPPFSPLSAPEKPATPMSPETIEK